MIAAGVLVVSAFVVAGEFGLVSWFLPAFVLFVSARFGLTLLFNPDHSEKAHIRFANLYALASLFLGLSWGVLSLYYYDISNEGFRIFLTVVNLGLITAGVGTLSAWMRAYHAFAIPQIVCLIIAHSLNLNVFVVLSLIIYSWFIFLVAKNTHAKFNQSRELIQENSQLIEQMDAEIQSRKQAQADLENSQSILEELIKQRTGELVETNLDLKEEQDKRSAAEKHLERIAYYDALTGLPNRALLIERIKQALIKAKRRDSMFGVLFVDLDRFKSINDSFGHDIGDKLIVQVAERIGGSLRESDLVARNGGDEFVILLEDMEDFRETFVVAEKVIECNIQSYQISEHEIHIGSSIGISVYPADGDDALDLLKMADTAMYYAKEQGSNHFEFYSSEMSNRIKARLEMENALRLAFNNDEFYLVYQPQVNAFSKETSGFEALLRWDSSTFGRVSPAEFVPILEETGLIYKVGEWVIKDVIRFVKSEGSRGKKVSINLSALQCGAAQYSQKIKELITVQGVNPALIEFEVTESILINDFSKTEYFLNEISELGCTIALDDFGTGYTSFSYLAKLSIDVIKIDRSLITSIDTEKSLQDIVKAIVTMCESLGIENVFEGVETQQELEVLQQLNAKTIQGYYFSKPLDVSELEQWFDSE